MKIRRKGSTSRQWSDDPSKGRLSVHAKGAVAIQFWMPSKGGGLTDVVVHLEPTDFEALFKAALAVDEDAALQAIGAALFDNKPLPAGLQTEASA
jgi:hypothetical protein